MLSLLAREAERDAEQQVGSPQSRRKWDQSVVRACSELLGAEREDRIGRWRGENGLSRVLEKMEPCSRTPGPNCLLYERGWAANEANDKNSTPQSNSVLRRRERPKNAAVRACVCVQLLCTKKTIM